MCSLCVVRLSESNNYAGWRWPLIRCLGERSGSCVVWQRRQRGHRDNYADSGLGVTVRPLDDSQRLAPIQPNVNTSQPMKTKNRPFIYIYRADSYVAHTHTGTHTCSRPARMYGEHTRHTAHTDCLFISNNALHFAAIEAWRAEADKPIYSSNYVK